MNTEAQELQRIISASVRDMLDAYRIQAQAGPVTDKALEEIIFRAAHGVVQSLATYPLEQRVALLPSVVRLLLFTVALLFYSPSPREPPPSASASR
jgi:hypothetical protein